MRYGICTELNNIHILESIGCDYIEIALNSLVSLNNEEFSKYIQLMKNSKVKCEAANCFFPGNMKIVGKDIEKDKISEYIKKVLYRASLLGVKVFVIGSGKSRKYPEDWCEEAALEQFSQVLFEIAQEAKKYNMMAVVEPLNKKETNIINSVSEGLQLVKNINHENLRLLADFYHMRVENENPFILKDAESYLEHVHIANSKGRFYPVDKNEDHYETFFSILREIGYDKRVSIEAATTDMVREGAAALNLLRQLTE
ncbi:MAG: sugar phosphate isomerase/epimerase family protein [Thermoplasmata archaeon]